MEMPVTLQKKKKTNLDVQRSRKSTQLTAKQCVYIFHATRMTRQFLTGWTINNRCKRTDLTSGIIQ